ncbi:MAG TPA: alpha/beta fold hydrolase [Actinoplanes sp.]|jgi:3-oxoadipate enol-lactonase
MLSYRRYGQGDPVVLLHPLALNGAVWGEFADRLSEQADVIAPDARGHGNSPWDGRAFTVEDLADDLRRLLDALGIAAAHLVGLSMGGSTAVTFAGRHPDRVRSLLLADTTAWYGRDAPTKWAGRAATAVNTPRERQLPFQLERWFTEHFRRRGASAIDRVVDAFLQTDGAAHGEACRALGGLDARPLLADISAPTLVLTGVEDYATPPAMGAAIADGVPRGKAEVLPGLRHLSLIERPELAGRVTELMREAA